jgi:hypothetical protein
MTDDALVLGIDLGTSTSAVGYMWNNAPQVLPSAKGDYTIPSDVFRSEDEFVVGSTVQKLAAGCPLCAVTDVKRLIGHQLKDRKVVRWSKLGCFQIDQECEYPLQILIPGDSGTMIGYPVGSIIISIIRDLIRRIRESINVRILGAVVSIPKCFCRQGRQELESYLSQAGQPAGFKFRFVEDDIAAAIAYVHHTHRQLPLNLLIVDFGGGKLQVSFSHIRANRTISGIETFGNADLGGRDFDFRLVEHCLSQRNVLRQPAYEQNRRIRALIRHGLLARCRAAKEDLTIEQRVTIDCSFSRLGIKSEPVVVTRALFDSLCRNEIAAFTKCLNHAISSARQHNIDAFDDLLLLGGSCKIPAVRAEIANICSLKPFPLEQAVVLGAILMSGMQHAAIPAQTPESGNAASPDDQSTSHDDAIPGQSIDPKEQQRVDKVQSHLGNEHRMVLPGFPVPTEPSDMALLSDSHLPNRVRDGSSNRNARVSRSSSWPSFDQIKKQTVYNTQDLVNEQEIRRVDYGVQADSDGLKAANVLEQSKRDRRANITLKSNGSFGPGLLAFLCKDGKLHPTWPHNVNFPNPGALFVDQSSSLSLTLSGHSSLHKNCPFTSILLTFEDWTMYPSSYYVEFDNCSHDVKWQLFHGTNDETIGTFPRGLAKNLPGAKLDRDGPWTPLPFIPHHGIQGIRLVIWAESKRPVSLKLVRFEIFGMVIPSENALPETH